MRAKALANSIGPSDPGFDMKAYPDESGAKLMFVDASAIVAILGREPGQAPPYMGSATGAAHATANPSAFNSQSFIARLRRA